MSARGRRWRALGATVVIGAVLTASVPATAGAPCLPLVCKFSVSGKKGRFLDTQVDDAQLAAADAKVSVKLSGGRSLAEQSVNRGEFAGTGLRMKDTERALDGLIAQFSPAWTHRAPPPVTVRIIGSTSFNPSARPDNVIVVPLGVLMRAKSDDEVAWVLAHEYSHIALAHFSRDADQHRLKSGVEQVVMGLQTAADMSQQRVDTSGQQIRFYSVQDKGAENFSDQAWAHSRDVGLALELLNQHLSRKQEDQADISGLDLILASHFSDEGVGQALDAVQEDEKRLSASLTTFQQQLGDVTQKAAARSLQKFSNGMSVTGAATELFDDVKRNVGHMMIEKLIEVAETSHRPAESRKRGVGAYMNDAYKTFDPPKQQTTWLTAVRASKEFQDASAAVEARDSALAKLALGTPQSAAEAWTALQPALATQYARTPLIANTTAKIYEALGDLPNADRQYGFAEHPPAPSAPPTSAPSARSARGGKGRRPPPAAIPAAPPPPPDILFVQSLEGYRDHVRLLLKMKAFPKALATIDEAKLRFNDDDAFLPALITIYAQTNKPGQLAAAISRCMDTEDDALRKQCQYAMLNDEQMKQVDSMLPADRALVETAMQKSSDATRRANWWQTISSQLAAPQQE